MNKVKLFIDFDNTIVNSTKAFCNCYNFVYQNHKNFKPAEYLKVEKYNFSDQCPLIHNVHTVFEDQYFFDKLEFMNDNSLEVIKELSKKYEIIICTIGTLKNISLKSIWLKRNLPFIQNHMFLVNNDCKMDKSLIDMSNSIFIDDVVSNLNTSNAELKFVFGDEYEWNITNKYERLFNWTDIKETLL